MANTMVGILPKCVDYMSNVALEGFQFGHLDIFGVKLGYLRINGKQMFALSQVLADLFTHVPRTTIRKRMEYLKIKRRRCDLQELRTLKAIKSVPTRAVKCTLISKEDLEALYTVYKAPECTKKKVKVKVREKGQFSSHPDSGYLSGFCRERTVFWRTRSPGVGCEEDSNPVVESSEECGVSERSDCRSITDAAGQGLTKYENVEKSTFCPVYRQRDGFYQEVACRYSPAFAVRFKGADGPVHFKAKYSCCNQSKIAGSGFIGNYNSSLPTPTLKSVKRMVLCGDTKALSETRCAQTGQGASLGCSSDSDCSLDPENDSDFCSTDEDEGESLLSGCSSDDESSSASDCSSAFSGASLHSIRFRRATLPSLSHKPPGVPGQPGPEERPELTAGERQSLYLGGAPQSRPICRQPGHGPSIHAKDGRTGDKNGRQASATEVAVNQPEPARNPTQPPHLTPNNFAKRGASQPSLKESSHCLQQRDLLRSETRSGASTALSLGKNYLKTIERDQAFSPPLNARQEGRIKQTFKGSDLSQNSTVDKVSRTHLRVQLRVPSDIDPIHREGLWNLGESESPGNDGLKRNRRKAQLTSSIHLNANGGLQSVRDHSRTIHRPKHSTSKGVQNRSTLQSKVSPVGRWDNGAKKKQVPSKRDKQLTSKRCPAKSPDAIPSWVTATGKRANLLKDSAKCKRVACGLATPVKKAFSLMGNFPSPPSLVVGDDGDLRPAYSFCSNHSCSMQKAHPVWRWQIGGTAIPLPPSHKFRGFSI
ncbi:SKI/DACH domain-containing protein 1-like [Narcine bancroftii]|uniref:SKI/DACH domain-containing protein 1-like n=1 Tax=Narcine bancroftii TaxID=1343680 RepID=UPI003831664F